MKKRSIQHDGEDHWVGWNRITNLYKKARVLDENKGTNEHTLYFTTIFETGGRMGEVVQLRPEQFTWNNSAIKIRRMEVLKRRKRYTRNVYIKIEGDPLANIFVDMVEDCDTKYLIPGYSAPFSRTIDPNEHASATHVYNKITAIDENVWPHWLRDQRSWQLSAKPENGGCGFDSYLLKEWFEWASMEMPSHYAGRRSEKDILSALNIVDPDEMTNN